MANPAINAAQPYYPPLDPSIPAPTQTHLKNLYTAINQHDAAIIQVQANLTTATAAATPAASTTTTTTTPSNASAVTSFNAATGAISYFPEMGVVNNQPGVVAYTTQSSDAGALITFNDASAIAVTLNFTVGAPWFTTISNQGAGTVTLTPSQGLVNGVATFAILTGQTVEVFFDGVNFDAINLGGVLPQTIAAVTSKWLTSYTASTGVFTSAQPAFSNISGTATAAQLPFPTTSTIGGVEAITAVAHQWISAISTAGVPQLSQPAAGDISGLGTAATKNTTGSGSAIPTGPTTSTSGDLVSFTGTAGQIADSGITSTNVPLLNATSNTFTGAANVNGTISAGGIPASAWTGYQGVNVSGAIGGVSILSRSLSAFPATLVAGDLFQWYVPDTTMIGLWNGVATILQVSTTGGLSVASLALTASTTTTTATLGAASALPATPAGYLEVNVNGTVVKIPYYNV